MAKSFSEHAYDKMLALYNKHDHEVGSELKKLLPDKYKDLESTDCITYSLNVISYAFKETGKNEAAKQVWKLGQHGNELATYLVNSHNWLGVYINPDVFHPTDKDDEHTYSHLIAQKKCTYYKIPLSYRVVNYRPTDKTHEAFQALNKHKGVTALNAVDINHLKSVKFGFGISRGGMHTWLFSKGDVYEVHWDKVGADLYEKTSLANYPWLSGAIVVPPDASHLLKIAELSCKKTD